LSLIVTAFLLAVSLSDRADDQPAPPLVTVEKGNLPIILSAPHGGRTEVPGAKPREPVNGAVLVRDDNTAELTALLADAIERELGGRPYVVIARFQRKFADANRAPAEAYTDPAAAPHYDAYHAALQAACEDVRAKWGRGALFDVHGQAKAPGKIIRGTADGQTVTDLLQRDGPGALLGRTSVLGSMRRAGYGLEPDDTTALTREERFNGGFIVRNYGSHKGTKIDAIQLELGAELRAKGRLAKTAKDLAAAIGTFARGHLPGVRMAASRPTSGVAPAVAR
jgi:N-formylglutamate amidohydrolase